MLYKADVNEKKQKIINEKNYKKKFKPYIKVSKKFIKLDDTEIEEYEFHQYKSPISTNDIDINKIVVSSKFLFGKQDFKYFVGYIDFEKIDLYACSGQKWLYIKEILMKIDVFIF